MVSKIRNSLNTERLTLNTNIGWKHKMELENGIRTMYEWYLDIGKGV